MADLSSSSRFVPSAHVHVREFDGELVVLDLKKGEYFALRDVGVLAWHRMCEGQCIAEVAAEVADTYTVSLPTALNDLLALSHEWLANGLVERSEQE